MHHWCEQRYEDFDLAFDTCDKGAKEKGRDQTADIACVKYFSAMEKDCWPCICKIASDNDWKVKGCDKIRVEWWWFV